MKTFKTILMFLIAGAINTNAQIPNNGFENWITTGNCKIPTGWCCPNNFADTNGSYFAVTRATDHYPTSVGNYSIRLENNVSLPLIWQGAGIAWTGDSLGLEYPAFPITSHPTSLCGYYKFLPQNNDTMDIHILLFKNGGEVAFGKLLSIGTDSVWASFVIPISEYTDADSARIMMGAFNLDRGVVLGNSVLYVDNLSFDTLITSVYIFSSEFPSEFNLAQNYPNPFNPTATIRYQLPEDSKVSLRVYNTLGQLIISLADKVEEAGFKSVEWNAANVASGVYFYRLDASSLTDPSRTFTQVKKMLLIR